MSNDRKLSFKERLIKKSFQPLVDKLLYACFYHYIQVTGNSDNLTYDEYCLVIKDLLKIDKNNEVVNNG